MDRCMELADKYGVGIVSVDNAFHYLWGGGYVIEAAKKGYIAYTNCPAALTEVVPFGGKFPSLGTNPHSWGFPTTDAVGFPICIDWATSVVAMGRVQVGRCAAAGLREQLALACWPADNNRRRRHCRRRRRHNPPPPLRLRTATTHPPSVRRPSVRPSARPPRPAPPRPAPPPPPRR
jgi:hypothetical protein